MKEISISKASVKDAEVIARLSRQTFYDAFAADNTKENMDKFMQEQFSKEELMKEVTDMNGIFFLAYDEDNAVGYVRMREGEKYAEFKNAPSIEIARIYALQSAIGKGVGSALIKLCIETAKELNKKILWLGVWEHNKRAIDFYSKWGFEKFGEHTFVLGDDPQTDWLMKKII